MSIMPQDPDSKLDTPPPITPNDGEYERAAALIDRIDGMGPAMAYRTVARLLAAQRAAYEAVADELEQDKQHTTDVVARLAMADAAARMRAVGR